MNKRPLRANVMMLQPKDGRLNSVRFDVQSADGTDLTGNQIIEAIAEMLILEWPNCPIEERHEDEFNS